MSHLPFSTPWPPSLHLGLTCMSPCHATALTDTSHLPTVCLALHHVFHPHAHATTLLGHCTTAALCCLCPTHQCPLHGPPPYTQPSPIHPLIMPLPSLTHPISQLPSTMHSTLMHMLPPSFVAVPPLPYVILVPPAVVHSMAP